MRHLALATQCTLRPLSRVPLGSVASPLTGTTPPPAVWGQNPVVVVPLAAHLAAAPVTTTTHHVLRVIFHSAPQEMTVAKTRWIIAAMPYHFTGGQWAVDLLYDPTMQEHAHSVDVGVSVPRAVRRPLELPTRRSALAAGHPVHVSCAPSSAWPGPERPAVWGLGHEGETVDGWLELGPGVAAG